MAEPAKHHTVETDGVGAEWVANHLGMSISSFRHKRETLEACGLQKPHPITRKYSKLAVKAWWMDQNGLANYNSNIQSFDEHLKHGGI